jgi:Leucine-rich repeat (LRR) protein
LDISSEDLTGTLDLNGFINLEKFNCSNNQLTSFLINLNPVTLANLSIGNNNFHSDLTIFSSLVNLETLVISNNQFIGSLAPLANLKKLKTLSIDNNQIDSGLEYLPESLKWLDYPRTKLATELEVYGRPDAREQRSFDYFSLLQL